ncbi:MAG: hypothetical protein HQL97_05170 [Magnetococcales bacterium]|nr:hypothetical protein [Magnetococcales bacterium]
MQITLGWELDGNRSGPWRPSSGEIAVGPEGLLRILETRLGLSALWPTEPRRISRYRRCLEQADTGQSFFSRSFKVDPLGVAKHLLAWRDALVEAGWQGDASAEDPVRVHDMARIERLARRTESCVANGRGDRLQAVILALATRRADIAAIRVVESPELWPAGVLVQRDIGVFDKFC